MITILGESIVLAVTEAATKKTDGTYWRTIRGRAIQFHGDGSGPVDPKMAAMLSPSIEKVRVGHTNKVAKDTRLSTGAYGGAKVIIPAGAEVKVVSVARTRGGAGKVSSVELQVSKVRHELEPAVHSSLVRDSDKARYTDSKDKKYKVRDEQDYKTVVDIRGENDRTRLSKILGNISDNDEKSND